MWDRRGTEFARRGGLRRVVVHGSIDCMQATTASTVASASTTTPKPAARARARCADASRRRARAPNRCRRPRGEIGDRLGAAEQPDGVLARERGVEPLARRAGERRRDAPIGAQRLDLRARFGQSLGEPVAPAVAADDEHARAAPRSVLQATPERFGVELRSVRARADDRRVRAAGGAQRARRAGPRRCRDDARRPGERCGRAAKKCCTALALTKTTRLRSASVSQAARKRRRVVDGGDLDQRQRLGVDAARAQIARPRPRPARRAA